MARRAATAGKTEIEDPKDALRRAQMTFYEVCDAKTAKQQVEIARKALAISPLCADAYVLLAEHARRGSDDEFALWQRAVDAGREALGDEFDDFEGEFWGFLETRPYMRARFGLAWALWERGRYDEAIGHLQAMLMLNPNDNQGVRYVLSDWLIETGRDAELAELLDRYDEDAMANWTWTGALAAFRKEGDSASSRKKLKKAMSSNAHVPVYLLGKKALPQKLPPFISPGQVDEAVHYVHSSKTGWDMTPGALDWLGGQLSSAKPKQTKSAGRRNVARAS